MLAFVVPILATVFAIRGVRRPRPRSADDAARAASMLPSPS